MSSERSVLEGKSPNPRKDKQASYKTPYEILAQQKLEQIPEVRSLRFLHSQKAIELETP
jgi:hypothetical protein